VDINQLIERAMELWNDGRYPEADRLLDQVEFLFKYGNGKATLSWEGMSNLLHALRMFQTRVMVAHQGRPKPKMGMSILATKRPTADESRG
jgi:hypothetical protein